VRIWRCTRCICTSTELTNWNYYRKLLSGLNPEIPQLQLSFYRYPMNWYFRHSNLCLKLVLMITIIACGRTFAVFLLPWQTAENVRLWCPALSKKAAALKASVYLKRRSFLSRVPTNSLLRFSSIRKCSLPLLSAPWKQSWDIATRLTHPFKAPDRILVESQRIAELNKNMT